MERRHFTTSEDVSPEEIIIVDRNLTITPQLFPILSSGAKVSLFSKKLIDGLENDFKDILQALGKKKVAYLFVVYDGDLETRSIFSELISYAKKRNTKMVLLIHSTYAREDILKAWKIHYPGLLIFVYGLIKSSVFSEDELHKILLFTFTDISKPSIIYLFPKYPQEFLEKPKEQTPIPHVIKQQQKKDYLSFLPSTLAFIVIVFFTPLILACVLTVIGYGFLILGEKLYQGGEQTLAYESSSASYYAFSAIEPINAFLVNGQKYFGFGKKVSFEQIVNWGQTQAVFVASLSDSFRLFSSLLEGASAHPEVDMKDATLNLKKALVFQQYAYASTPNEEKDGSITRDLFGSSSDFLPELFGMNGKRAYMVLLENNSFLMGSGGKVEGFGIISFDKGKVTEASFDNVTSADEKLRGHVDAPSPLVKYGNRQHFSLKDSNFDLDFPESSALSAFFLKEELGKEINGVVSIDSTFLKSLLAVNGSVYLPEYRQTVTDKTMDQFLSESVGEKKNDRLAILTKHLFPSLAQKAYLVPEVISGIDTALLQKHMLLSSFNPSIQTILKSYGVSSIFPNNKNDGFNDTTGINETNLGQAQSASLNRSIVRSLQLDTSGNISEKMTVTYQNVKTAWPWDTAKQYMRFFLPPQASDVQIAIDGEKKEFDLAALAPSQPTQLTVDKSNENGYLVYGFYLVIPPASEKQITLYYKLDALSLNNKSSLRIDETFVKQPSTDAVPYSFVMTYPRGYKLTSDSEGVKTSSGKVSYNGNLVKDAKLTLQITH